MQIIKKFLYQLIRIIVGPFYWTGLGNYWPFNILHNLYQKFSMTSNIVYKTKYDFSIKLTTGLLIDDTILYRWVREPWITKIIIDNLHSWDVFLDIWANIWYYSLLASNKVQPKGKIIAFEPNTINYEKFLENIKINNFKNIDIKKKWVGNDNIKLDLFYDKKNPWATSLVKGKNHSKEEKETIDIVKLDDMLWEDMRVDFIKLDIEWFEYEAMLWMKNILSKNQKIKMIFEFSPYIYKRKEKNYILYSINILKYLSNLWFCLFHISKHNWKLEKITNYNEYMANINSENWQSDIYCAKIS